MDEDMIFEEMVNSLEANGEIRLTGDGVDISIHSIDDKEGYSYISNNNKQFDESQEAIEWAILQFDGSENIEEWE